MRILLKEYQGKAYVWKDATYENECYLVDGNHIEEVCIASVMDHPATGMVICNNCGALIPNTPEAIAEHGNARANERDCIKCNHHTFDRNRTITKEELVPTSDGRYKVVQEFESRLYCQQSYYMREVNSSDAIRNCIYLKCRNAGMRKPRGILAVQPDAFNSAITVDILKAKKLGYVEYDGKYFRYDMRSRGTIQACVNSSGIVECFNISSRGNRMDFYYSERYDKLYYNDFGWYKEGCPNWFRREKYDEALEKIRALYEGAEKK